MKIAIFYPVVMPAKTYGGAERVVVNLVRGLAERGHEVFLLAAPGTDVPQATHVPVPFETTTGPEFPLERVIPPGCEVLISNGRLGVPPTGIPWLQILHGNRGPGEAAQGPTVHISEDHARRHGSESWIYNGIDLDELTFQARKGPRDLFLGRAFTIKGYHWAIAATRRLGRPLDIAGWWRPSFSSQLRYLGKVGGARKAALLAEARLFWMPALWDEPFGLTLVEAMASGTPVLGTRRGSLPEIVTPDVGRLGTTLDELIAHVPDCERIAPEAGRARVEKWFTYRSMAEEYERFVRELLRSGTLPKGRRAE